MATTYHHSSNVTGWVGWLYFAACLMLLAGIFQGFAGLVAMFKDSVYVVNQSHLVVFDYTQWGIIHLILGIVLVLSSLSLFAGQMWGRIVGVILATLSAIANFAFLQAYPWWSITVIILDVLIIYAITMHGSEAKE
jgi:hypothetical protein